ncbi:hypothetical protein NEPAR04_2470 [Nematocida parisii]|nr:hypothetical protein NEPAR08_1449 [Nematocida parisii]KAI5129156.1 hypothetical protein NEPAR03_1556 [Nematocida parisii]KAI5145523.1 hypothetical protein NEPAR04_2470 [Nematocida parisii]
MVGYINEPIIWDKIEKELINNDKLVRNKDDIFKIISDINGIGRIFTELPEPMVNLAYNILYMKLVEVGVLTTDLNLLKSTGLDKIKNAIKSTNIIINIIMRVGEEIQNNYQRKEFYNLMGSNYIIMMYVYKIRSNFYNYSINILCEKAGIPKLNGKVSQEKAISKLCKLTKSKKCSRIVRVLDILMNHGDNLIITNKNGIEQSNASKLQISKDDIKSLQLLTRTYTQDGFSSYVILNNSLYRLFYIKSINFKHNPVYNLYNEVFNMCINPDTNETETDSYINIIKEHLNQLQSAENTGKMFMSEETALFDFIKKHNTFNTEYYRGDEFQNYLKSIIFELNNILANTMENIRVEKIEEPNKIPPNELVPESSDEQKPNEQISLNFWSTKLFKIITVILIITYIIILSIFMIYPTEAKRIVNNFLLLKFKIIYF